MIGAGLLSGFAITPDHEAAAQTLITTNTNLNGTQNGNDAGGYYVTSGNTLTVNNGSMVNFTTTGGSGSGGGLGAGGAIFVATGGTAVLNSVNFSNDTAIGGIGGTNSPYGGSLNNGILQAASNGTTGANGVQPQDNLVLFGGGLGDGFSGFSGASGGAASNGTGGAGGAGSYGTSGWSTNPPAITSLGYATTNLVIAGENSASAALGVASATALAAGLEAEGAALDALGGLGAGDNAAGAAAGTSDAQFILLVTSTTAADALAAAQEAQATAYLTAWQIAASNGTVAIGGNGGNGGAGGAGSYGFGGGPGGAGAVGGAGGTSSAPEGNSGSGGAGGAGGFGAGGGAGGFGASNTGDSNQGQSGSGGAGGAAGFGGGVGSVGGVNANNNPSGCNGVGYTTTGAAPSCPGNSNSSSSSAYGGGGGSGYGGAIFVNAGGTLLITGNSTFAYNNTYGGTSQNGGVAGGAAGTDLFLMAGAAVSLAPGAGNVITFNGTIADNSVTSIGSASNSVGNGASLTTYAGLTVFNGQNTYSGQTIIQGGAYNGPLNTNTNTTGLPNFATTGGALQAANGVGLPTDSLLNFAGPSQFTGGVLQTSGTFERWAGAFNSALGINADRIEWTGSGGFAASGGPLTVTLNAGQNLTWGQGNFVPFGSSLMFGSANSTDRVTFTNAINTTGGTISVVVVNNGNASSDALLSGVLSGTGNVSVNGGGYNGVLNLSAANTYTGTTTINSGTLALTGLGSIADSSNITNNGTFDISNTTSGASITTLAGSGTVALGAQVLTITNGSTTFSGVIADGGLNGGVGGGLTVAGGTQTLTGANSYTGATKINSGATLALSGMGSISSSSGVADNGVFDISQTTLGATITTLSGSGTASLGSKLLVVSNGSTTFSGVIADGGIGGGTGGKFSVTGGTQTLTGHNTYTGGTQISSGATLALSSTGSIATSQFVNSLGTFDISQTTSGASIITLMGSGHVALGAQNLNITAAATTFSGVIADGGIGGGTGGSLTVSGGLQTLTGDNTYTGATSISALAELALSGTGSIAASSGVAANGTFDISQTTSGASIMTLSGAGAVDLGAQLLTITAGSTTFSGVIADGGIASGVGGALTVSGGTQTLTGQNTYTGGTQISSGATLALSGAGSIATSEFVNALGTFDISQTSSGASITTLEGSGNVALGAQNLTITSGSTTFSGVIADGGIGNGTGGSFTVSGGSQTLTGVNTYTGATTVASGAALYLSGAGSIATSSEVTDNGWVDISATTSGTSFMTLAGSGMLNLGSKPLTITAGSTNFSGVMGGSGALNVTGGSQTLSGVNLYTGATSISSGATLALSGAGSIAASSGLMDAGTFNIAATTSGASITTLGGAGSVVLGSETLTITAGAAGAAGTTPAGVFSGVISGNGGVAITGGHQELTGVNTYSGGTTVANATLSINSGASLGAPTGPLTLNNAMIVADANISTPRPVTLLGTDVINTNSFAVSFSGNISGSGSLDATGGGSLNLTGTNTSTGGIVLGPNTTLTSNSNTALGSGPITVVAPNGSAVTLFTGSVHVDGPIDLVNSANPELIIQPGEQLVGVGSVNVPVVVQGGGGSAPGDGPGTIVATTSYVAMTGSTTTFDIDGATSSVNCVNVSGCAGTYATIAVIGTGNTFTAGGVIAPVLRGISAPANNNYTPPVTSSFVVVQAVGGVLGSFSSLTQPASGLAPGTRFDDLYTSNAITLYVTPQNYQDLSAWNTSLTQNQNQVAAALNALRGTAGPRNGTMATNAFGTLYQIQPQALPTTFDTLSGEAIADAKFAAQHMTSQFLELLLDPSVNGRNFMAPRVDHQWTAWATAFGGGASAAGNTSVGSHDVSGWAGGLATGADYHFDANSVAGFAVAGGATSWGVTQGLGGGHSTAFQAGAYGSTHLDALYFAGSASVANHWMTTNRVAVGGDSLGGSFSAQSYGARLETGYRYAVANNFGVTPYGAVEFQNFSRPSFNETDAYGGSFGLAYNSSSQNDLKTELGGRFDTQVEMAQGVPLNFTARVAWQHEALTNQAMTATFLAAEQTGAMPGAATSFSVYGAPTPSNSVYGSLFAEMYLTPAVSVSLKGEYADGLTHATQSYGGTGAVRVTW